MAHIKVILKKSIPKLGDAGEIVNVSEGYARNYLLPRGFGVVSTPEALRAHETVQHEKARAAEMDLRAAQALAERVDGQVVEIEEKVSPAGTLFASVTQKMIAAHLHDAGFTVPESSVQLHEAIKEVGEYDVLLNLPHGLEAKIQVIVKGSKNN